MSYDELRSRNNYWKIDPQSSERHLMVDELRTRLAKQNYHVGSMKSSDRLRRCLRRSDVGLPSYFNCSNDEMRAIIHSRGIQTDFGNGNKGQRKDLIKALEQADDKRSFNKFLSLPPELRNRVYGYYLAEFERPLYAPKQPPLTLTCSLIRAESLPLFYKTCTFGLALERQVGNWSRTVRWTMPKETMAWIMHTSAKEIAGIKHLTIRIEWNGLHDVSIDISNAGDTIRARTNALNPLVLRKKDVERSIQRVLKKMLSRGAKVKLEKDDFGELQWAITKALKK